MYAGRCAHALFNPFSIRTSAVDEIHKYRRTCLYVLTPSLRVRLALSLSLFHCTLSHHHLICRFELQFQVRCFIEVEKSSEQLCLVQSHTDSFSLPLLYHPIEFSEKSNCFPFSNCTSRIFTPTPRQNRNK